MSAAEFRRVMRAGRRRSGELLATHSVTTSSAEPARFGFVVSKAVGGAVRRNAVKRRLRALCWERVVAGSTGIEVVVRALPAAASADFAVLRAELGAQLEAAERAGTDTRGTSAATIGGAASDGSGASE